MRVPSPHAPPHAVASYDTCRGSGGSRFFTLVGVGDPQRRHEASHPRPKPRVQPRHIYNQQGVHTPCWFPPTDTLPPYHRGLRCTQTNTLHINICCGIYYSNSNMIVWVDVSLISSKSHNKYPDLCSDNNLN